LQGCIFMATAKNALAGLALSDALDIAISNGDMRRLWRVRANLATLAEIRGDLESALVYDLQSIRQMPIALEFRNDGMIGGRGSRLTGALINVLRRSKNESARYVDLEAMLGNDICVNVENLSDELEKCQRNNLLFAGGLNRLYQRTGNDGLFRFLITE
jgi:hypothetical protein